MCVNRKLFSTGLGNERVWRGARTAYGGKEEEGGVGVKYMNARCGERVEGRGGGAGLEVLREVATGVLKATSIPTSTLPDISILL